MEFAASFALVMPELVLIAAGLVLLLVAAWGGDKAARGIAIAAAAALSLLPNAAGTDCGRGRPASSTTVV